MKYLIGVAAILVCFAVPVARQPSADDYLAAYRNAGWVRVPADEELPVKGWCIPERESNAADYMVMQLHRMAKAIGI